MRRLFEVDCVEAARAGRFLGIEKEVPVGLVAEGGGEAIIVVRLGRWSGLSVSLGAGPSLATAKGKSKSIKVAKKMFNHPRAEQKSGGHNSKHVKLCL